MSDTTETLSLQFPLFSKELISEVVRLKGENAHEALTRLACDDVEDRRPSQLSSQGYDCLSCAASVPSALESYPLSDTDASMSMTSGDEADDVLSDINSPASQKELLTKAKSSQSSRPDVVLGEEGLERMSCPEFYDIERRCFEVEGTDLDHSRPHSPFLEELFSMPLDVSLVMLSSITPIE